MSRAATPLSAAPASASASAAARVPRRRVWIRPRMRVLCINAGSSSVKIALYEVQEQGKPQANGNAGGNSHASAAASASSTDAAPEQPAMSVVDGTGARLLVSKSLPSDEDPVATLRRFVEQQQQESQASSDSPVPPILLVVHRIVHGGSQFHAPTLLTPDTLSQLDSLSPLAPLHNPPALRWARAAQKALCEGSDAAAQVRQVGMFDTAFFHDLPLEAQTYALPASLTRKHGLRRYGFHGLAHEHMMRVAGARVSGCTMGGRLITLQLGSGASAAAILNGRPLDTSMGFTPLEGLVMSSRGGDLDPAILTFLAQHEPGLADPAKMDDMLSHKAGLKGVSDGESGDMRHLEASETSGARLAIDVFVHRLIKYIGAYVALLGGLDTLCFGGGIGENSWYIRSRVLAQLEKSLPLLLDFAANRQPRRRASAGLGEQHRCISRPDSKVAVWVVAVDEQMVMLKGALQLTQPDGQQSQL